MLDDRPVTVLNGTTIKTNYELIIFRSWRSARLLRTLFVNRKSCFFENAPVCICSIRKRYLNYIANFRLNLFLRHISLQILW